jgi:Diguanylate cyclase, GGDEF domain/Cache domain
VLESLLRRSWFFYVAVPLGVMAPVVFMFFAARSVGRSQEESQAYDQTAQTARLTAIVLDHHFHTAVERLESIAHRPSLHRDIAHENWHAVKEELRLNSSVYPEIAYLGVLSARGGKLNAIYPLGPPAFLVDFSQRDWYKGVTGNGAPYVSAVFQLDSSPHSQVVGVAVPIFDDDGGPIAVLVAGHRLDTASSWLQELQPSSAVIIEVVDQQGHVLSFRAPQQPQQSSETLDASSKELVRRALAVQSGAGVFLRQGKPAIVSYRPVPGLHWGVLAELPLERVHLPWNRFQSVVIPMAALLVVVVVSFAFSTVRVTQAAEKRLRDKLQEQSVRDPLTGTYNRRYLEEPLKREIRRAERAGQPVGLLMIDVDYFKTINDFYGHDAGDFVLQDLAKVLQSHVRGRRRCLPFRRGGVLRRDAGRQSRSGTPARRNDPRQRHGHAFGRQQDRSGNRFHWRGGNGQDHRCVCPAAEGSRRSPLSSQAERPQPGIGFTSWRCERTAASARASATGRSQHLLRLSAKPSRGSWPSAGSPILTLEYTPGFILGAMAEAV